MALHSDPIQREGLAQREGAAIAPSIAGPQPAHALQQALNDSPRMAPQRRLQRMLADSPRVAEQARLAVTLQPKTVSCATTIGPSDVARPAQQTMHAPVIQRRPVPTDVDLEFFDDEIPAIVTLVGFLLFGGQRQLARYKVKATGQEFFFENATGFYYNLEGQRIDPSSLAPALVEATTGHPPDDGPPPDRSAIMAEQRPPITLGPDIHDAAQELDEVDLEPSSPGSQLLILAGPLLLRLARLLVRQGVELNPVMVQALDVLIRIAARNPDMALPTGLVLSALLSFCRHLIEQTGDVSGRAEWQLRSAVDRLAALGRDEDAFPEIGPNEWQRLIALSSLAAEKSSSVHFTPHARLLNAVRARIGRHAAHALVLGADKDLLYPYLATGAKESTLVSTDANSPHARARNLMVDAGLAYPASPPSVMAHGNEASIHVTSGVSAHAFHLYDMLYGEFFGEHATDDEYDFLLDKTSYLGMDMFDLSRFVRALKTGGYWLTHFSYLDRNQRLVLKLLGLEDVTETIITREQAGSFPGGKLQIYRKVVHFPPQWIDLVHAWFGMVQDMLNATRRGKTIPLYPDRDMMNQYLGKYRESMRLLYALQAVLLDTENDELRDYLQEAFDELLQLYREMHEALADGFKRTHEEEERERKEEEEERRREEEERKRKEEGQKDEDAKK